MTIIDPEAVDISELLLEIAERQPGEPALLAPGREVATWGTLGRMIEQVERRLAGWDIRRGDVVVCAIGNRFDDAYAMLALPSGATVTPLNQHLTAERFAGLLARLRPKAVVAGPDTNPALLSEARRLGIAEISWTAATEDGAATADLRLARSGPALESAPRVPADWAYLSTTSGTTGAPKLVPMAHRRVMAAVRAVGECLEVEAADRSAHLTPLHLANGIRTALLLAVMHGGAVNCLEEGDIATFLDETAAGRVSFTSASFTILRELLRVADAAPRVERGRLRFLRVASGRLEDDEMERLERCFGVTVLTGLGSTETGMVAHQRLPPARITRGSVGAPLASTVRLVDEHGRPVARGEAGELQVRGPQVFDGYFDDPELNASSHMDGWFRMGDLARQADDGDLTLVGRVKEVINRGGEKIAPLEIDAVLRAMPELADAAAFAVPHERLGDEVAAAVVLRPGATVSSAAVKERVRSLLGARHAPRHVWFVDALPRNAAGKLLRTELPAWVGAPVTASASEERTAGAARSPLEAALAGVWGNVLESSHIDRDDDFRALGGDEHRGAVLIDQVRALFGVDLPVVSLFEDAGTVAGMARRIERERTKPSAAEWN